MKRYMNTKTEDLNNCMHECINKLSHSFQVRLGQTFAAVSWGLARTLDKCLYELLMYVLMYVHLLFSFPESTIELFMH